MSYQHTCTTVSLLRREITGGRLSLYLDFYPAVRNPETMKMTRREYLGIYIYARLANDAERNFNRTMLEKAEAIRRLRVTPLINDKFDFLDHDKMRGDFLAYFRKMCCKKYEKWDIVYRHFSNFTGGHCTFGDITIELCKGFGEYLLGAHQLQLTHRKVSRNSAAGYFSAFRGLLKITYRDKLIRANVNDFLDKIETEDAKNNYLTLDELKRLAATPCQIDVLKRASLFSCLTGLRISDVLKLKWEDFEIAPDWATASEFAHRREDADRGDAARELGSARTLRRAVQRYSVQWADSQYDKLSVEKVNCGGQHQKEHHIPPCRHCNLSFPLKVSDLMN